MKRVTLFFVAVLVVAGLAGFGAVRLSDHHRSFDHGASHEWLHRELRLTVEQERALEPIEARFSEKHRALATDLREAHQALGRVIKEEKRFTPRVATAIETLHRRIGDLQKASIEHVFEMQAVLSPEQSEKLLALAQQAFEYHDRPRSH